MLFPYDNIVAGIGVLIMGFFFHWVVQLISAVNWDFAMKIGLQEKGMIPEFKVYEHAIATADAIIGVVYAIAGVGLLLNLHWGYKLAFIPGTILVYQGISFWVWEGNRRKLGHRLIGNLFRVLWSAANLVFGLLTLAVCWRSL